MNLFLRPMALRARGSSAAEQAPAVQAQGDAGRPDGAPPGAPLR
jgi:hypothetical protein